MAEVEHLLSRQDGMLSVPVMELTRLHGTDPLERFINDRFKHLKPSVLDYSVGVLSGAFSKEAGIAAFTRWLTHMGKMHKHGKEVREVFKRVDAFTAARSTISFTNKEQEIFRRCAQLAADSRYAPNAWHRHLALMIWNGGQCLLVPDPDVADAPEIEHVRRIVSEYITSVAPKHDAFLAEAASHVAKHHGRNAPTPNNPAPLSLGAHWITPDELRSSPYYQTKPSRSGLIIGYEPDTQLPIYYSGHESLITLAAPGSGKSQVHVIPNLLHSPGSAIVLDVKDELWQKTAGYRAKHFGPVYRFAPTDPTGNTHRYNPFDFIPTDPEQAAREASVFSYQVVADNPKLSEPYWTDRGRDFLWAFAMMIALKGKGHQRTMRGLTEVMNLPLIRDPDADIFKVLDSMRRNAKRTGIFELQATADAIEAGIVDLKRLESIVDTGRRYLNLFGRNKTLTNAMSGSDWNPAQLRLRPGTTVYICVPGDDLQAFSPVIRVMLMQHARQLLRHAAKPDETPITFFLDEMPQLGNFKAIIDMQDVGRGAGLRLWMFAQRIGQLSDAFGPNAYKGIIDACRVRCFMQPEAETAHFLEPILGKKKNMFTGEQEPLASVAELMGHKYGEKTIVTTRGSHPMALEKRFAFKTEAHKFLPPPRIK